MTDTIDVVDSMTMMEPDGDSAPARGLSTEELAAELLARADGDPVRLVGPGGLLGDLTKRVLEAALEAEMTEHVGYEPYDPAGHHSGNSRNGTRSKTVITDIGPIEIDVPRDRVGSFEPVMVPKRKRRLGGVDQMVLSLSAKGLTHGEISAHLEEIYGAKVSKETVTRITDGVLETMVEWQNRPLDAVYPVMFIDAVHVKIREGQVANRPIYVAIGVTVDGERGHPRSVGGPGRRGGQVLGSRADRDQEPGHQGRVHPGLRRAHRAARGGGLGVAADHRARLCGAHDPGQLPLCQPPGLAGAGQGSQADLHGGDRGRRLGTAGRVRRPLGDQVPGHRDGGNAVGRLRVTVDFVPPFGSGGWGS